MATSTIYEFDGDAGNPLLYTWRGKVHLLPRSAAFVMCRVRAADYTNLVLRLYSDDALLVEKTVTSSTEFVLPVARDYNKFEIEVYGTSRVYSVQVVESAQELT